MTTINSKAASDKRRMESAVHTLHAEIDDSLTQAKAKRALEAQITELEMRLGEANELAAKGGRTAMAKLETRIRELEIELGSTQAKTGENFKSFQKAERHVKELQFQHDEDKKNQDRMSELAVKLQQKIKPSKYPCKMSKSSNLSLKSSLVAIKCNIIDGGSLYKERKKTSLSMLQMRTYRKKAYAYHILIITMPRQHAVLRSLLK